MCIPLPSPPSYKLREVTNISQLCKLSIKKEGHSKIFINLIDILNKAQVQDPSFTNKILYNILKIKHHEYGRCYRHLNTSTEELV